MFITFTAEDRTSGIHWTKVWNILEENAAFIFYPDFTTVCTSNIILIFSLFCVQSFVFRRAMFATHTNAKCISAIISQKQVGIMDSCTGLFTGCNQSCCK
jgi:hypothetical protein